MAKTRAFALQCSSCLIAGLFVQPIFASETTPLPLPTEQISTSLGLGFERVLIALLAVIGLIIAVKWLLKRFSRSSVLECGAGKTIKILDRMPMGPRQSLLLVQVKCKGVLLHQSKTSLTALCEVELEGESTK